MATSHAAQRLLALLAVCRRPVRRSIVSASLWPETDDAHAGQNLRSVLHRLCASTELPVVAADRSTLCLTHEVRVDLHDCTDLALRVCDGEMHSPPGDGAGEPGRPAPVDLSDLPDHRALTAAFREDLLPDWHDEWLHFERERHRQLRMHALEALAGRLRTARRAVIEVHLAEGNVGEALRQYDACRHLLDDGLGIRPSKAPQALVFSQDG